MKRDGNVSIEYVCSRRAVSSELVKVMVPVGKKRRGRRAIDGHRINGGLSFIHIIYIYNIYISY